MKISETILEQLGGSQFIAMTGAKNLVDMGAGLNMKIGRNAKRITHVMVAYDCGTDTYTVQFLRVTRRGLDVEPISEHSLIYADQLRELFERQTGLLTRL